MVAKERDVWLDFIRALAITSVVICHFSSFHAETLGVPKVRIFSAIGLGGYGVDLFFVLSGWLLGGILLKEIQGTGNLDLKNFYRKRWLRTLPCYFAVLSGTLLQRAVSQKFQVVDLAYFGFLQTYLFDRLGFLTISWSLCVEEHFYLLIAPCLLLLRRSKFLTGVALLCFIALPLFFKAMGWYQSSLQTHVRLDQCTFGVLLAFLRSLNQELFKNSVARFRFMAWLGILALGGMFFCRLTQRGFFHEHEWITPIAGIFVVQSVCPLSGWIDRICRSGLIQYLASRSYCLYFCHVEALFLLRRLGLADLTSMFIFFPPVCFLMTELLHRVIERPFMSIRIKKSESDGLSILEPNVSSEKANS
jgi:peptidoglycan/LPS O-acetylase OafA/YrhL